MSAPQLPMRFDLEVPPNGRIEVELPMPVGSHVTVYVVGQTGERFEDLTAAAATSMDFWDNPLDDEDWNNA